MKEKFSQVIAIRDNVGGCSVMEHHNLNGWILVCEDCADILREQLKEESCWDDLSIMDSDWGSKYFLNIKELEEWFKTKTTVAKAT